MVGQLKVVLLASVFAAVVGCNCSLEDELVRDPIPPREAGTKGMTSDEVAVMLVNYNKPPMLGGDAQYGYALFPEEYDWAEQDRIQGCISQLISSPDVSLLPLSRIANDERYCLTIGFEGLVMNVSVGMVARLIVRDTLTYPCLSNSALSPENRGRFRAPDIIDYDRMSDWFSKKQQSMSVVQMQREVLQWSMSKLKSKEGEDAEDDVAGQLAGLGALDAELSSRVDAIPMRSFFDESRWLYTSSHAARIRKRHGQEAE